MFTPETLPPPYSNTGVEISIPQIPDDSIGLASQKIRSVFDPKQNACSPVSVLGSLDLPVYLEKCKVDFRLHWLAVTIWETSTLTRRVATALLGLPDDSDDWQILPHGGKGFKVMSRHCLGAVVASEPIASPTSDYCSLVLSGDLASTVSPEALSSVLGSVSARWRVSRLDFAFDHATHVPKDFYDAVMDGRVSSHAKRSTLRRITEPFTAESDTVYLGARQSERMLRIYLRDGHTRTELETKGERATAILADLIEHDGSEWPTRCMGHLLDFVRVDMPWWETFCTDSKRAELRLEKLPASLERTGTWVETSVSASLAMLTEAQGIDWLLDGLLLRGEERMKPKHHALLRAFSVSRG